MYLLTHQISFSVLGFRNRIAIERTLSSYEAVRRRGLKVLSEGQLEKVVKITEGLS